MAEPDKNKLVQCQTVTEKVLQAVEDLLYEQQKMFREVSENLYEMYFANKAAIETVLEKGGVAA